MSGELAKRCAAHWSSVAGSVRATTTTALDRATPYWSASTSSTLTDSSDRGITSRSLTTMVVDSSGSPAPSSRAAVPSAVTNGRRWTARASPAKNPDSPSAVESPLRAWRRSSRARDRFDGRTRRPNRPSSAAVNVIATSTETSVMEMPAAPSAESPVRPKTSSPLSAAATVRPEKTMVRPAVAHARAIASVGSCPAVISSR